jgi:uncharacterized repeat protein (TIGR03803 family)
MGKPTLGLKAFGVLLLAMVALGSPAQTLTTVHSFHTTDGANPAAGLLRASNGNFYGTTYAGGVQGVGTVFEMTPGGTLTTLHSFQQLILADGYQPYAGLMQARDGNLYGTTNRGGVGRVGSIFKVTPNGTVTQLASFAYQPDGADPYDALVQGANGSLYGTAAAGGGGAGTVFEVSTFGQITKLYNIGSHGESSPVAGLVLATNGDFYGTTSVGGTYSCGTIFQITPGGAFTVLHSFTGHDGCNPYAAMVQGSDGNLYGTASTGGAASGYNAGTAFKITPSGAFTLLHVFDITDGEVPLGALVQASDGDFYGTTELGGANNRGTIFQMTPSGGVTTLYSFCAHSNCPDGANPYAGLILANDGNYYGTTYSGGSGNAGTVFRFAP